MFGKEIIFNDFYFSTILNWVDCTLLRPAQMLRLLSVWAVITEATTSKSGIFDKVLQVLFIYATYKNF